MFDFQSLRNSVKSINEQHANLHVEIAANRQLLTLVANARLHRDDIKVLLSKWVDTSAEKFSSQVVAKVAKGNFNTFSLFSGPDGRSDPAALNAFMCATFGKQIQQALSSSVDAMESIEEGLPSAKRLIEIERLDKLLRKLVTEVSELESKAEDAGIKLD
jgi:hypothetical protein